VYGRVRILTWNLKHGRSVPSSGRDLLDQFAAMLAGWEWDVALLQEVPPWWAAPLAERSGAIERHVLTSRNSLLAVRRAIATRWPDVIKSNGGGCNAILVRAGSVAEHRTRRLALVPERRWVHGVRLLGISPWPAGLWVANLHTGASLDQARLAAETASRWAATTPVVLGGDFNLRDFSLDGFVRAGRHGVDQIFIRARDAAPGQIVIPDRGHLSDHAPVLVTLLKEAQ
jgi:endonuclease/exonuclease/phosphatase family metal-dependent hydrolase